MPSRRVQGKFNFTYSVLVLSHYICLSFKWSRFFWFTDQNFVAETGNPKKNSGSDGGIDAVSGLLAYSVVRDWYTYRRFGSTVRLQNISTHLLVGMA